MHPKAVAATVAVFAAVVSANPILSSTAVSAEDNNRVVSSALPLKLIRDQNCDIQSPSSNSTDPEVKRAAGNPEGLHVIMGDETYVFRNFYYGTRGVPLSYPNLLPELLQSFA